MKAEVLARALTSNEYTKIGNFVDKPLPPHAVKRCTITTATQPRSSPSISISELLSRQNRKLLKMVGDGNCFFRAIATLFHGSQEKHADVRNEIVGHIGKTANKFSAFMPRPTQVQQHYYYNEEHRCVGHTGRNYGCCRIIRSTTLFVYSNTIAEQVITGSVTHLSSLRATRLDKRHTVTANSPILWQSTSTSF